MEPKTLMAEITLRAYLTPSGRLTLEVVQPDTPAVAFSANETMGETGPMPGPMPSDPVSLGIDGALADRPLRTALAQAVVDRLRARARRAGADLILFDKVVAGLEQERPILDWLKNGGFDALLKFILELIAAFK